MKKHLKLFEEFVEEKKKANKPKKNTAAKMKDVDKKIKKAVKKAKTAVKDVKKSQEEIKGDKATPEDKMRGALAKLQTQKHQADIKKQSVKKMELAVKSKIQTLKKKEKAAKKLEEE